MRMFEAVRIPHAAEGISFGHPDKLIDRVADAIVDAVLQGNQGIQPQSSRVTIEGVVVDKQLILMGEIIAREVPDIERIVRRVWKASGYGIDTELVLCDYIVKQHPERQGDCRMSGASDQGIMIGYATNETQEMLPREFVLARRLWDRALECRDNGIIPWMRTNIKTQVTLDADGKVTSAAIIAHYVDSEELTVESKERGVCTQLLSASAYHELLDQVFVPVLYDHLGAVEPTYTVKNIRSCTIGGPCTLGRGVGRLGRQGVTDTYGPRVPIGGAGYSGKDPTRIDRCGAYMARHIAKTIVMYDMARECLVRLAYAAGEASPVMISAITEEGRELGGWVHDHFDLTSWAIIERLSLSYPQGWSYYDTATYGHYGYNYYPWEKVI